MSNTTTRTPEPLPPTAIPDGYPPVRPVLRDHFLRWFAVYLIAGSTLTLAGIAWTIWEVRALRFERSAQTRTELTERLEGVKDGR